MKIKVSSKDVLWSYCGYFLSLFTNLIVLPFVMKFVAATELGLWYTFLSIGQIVTIFDGMFSGSISRNITYAWSGAQELKSEGVQSAALFQQKINYHLLVSILMTCKRIFAVIATVALVFFMTAGTAYIGYTAKEVDVYTWVAAWIVYCVGLFTNLYYSYWVTALRGVGAIQQSQKASIVSKATQVIVSVVGLFCGGGIIALSLAGLLSGIVLRIMGKAYLFRYENIEKHYREFSDKISKSEIRSNFKAIWHNAKKSGLVCVGAFAITQSTTLICASFLGLEETASYGLTQQIINCLVGVSLIYFNTIRPKLTELKVSGDDNREQFVATMSLAVTIYYAIFAVGMIGLIGLGLPVLSLLKSDTELPVVMVVFMGIYMFLENNHSMFAGIIEMSNTVPYVKASLISAVCIVVFDLISAKFTTFGIYGLMMVQCVVQLCYSNWKWPMVIMKQYHLSPFRMIRIGAKEGMSMLRRLKH